MSKKEDLKKELTEKGIAFNDKATNPQLEALLSKGSEGVVPAPVAVVPNVPEAAPEPEAPSTKEMSGITVRDPKVLRPVELPLVVEGKWKNKEQAQYAKYLNSYAYQNTAKWETKKKTLLKRLVEIGENPERLSFYRGQVEDFAKLTISNKTLEE